MEQLKIMVWWLGIGAGLCVAYTAFSFIGWLIGKLGVCIGAC